MIVSVQRLGRNPAGVAFDDLTTKQIVARGYVAHDDGTETYDVQFAVNLTAAERAAVERRLATGTAVEETVHERAETAMDGLRQIRDSTGTLTAAQLSNAVRLLARVALALIRLQLRRLDAAD